MAVAPLLVSCVVALAVTPRVTAMLAQAGRLRPNYRGARLVHPSGAVLMVASLATLTALAAFEALAGARTLPPGIGAAAVFVLGVGLLGVIDDAFGERDPDAPRGLRGHARSLARGRPSTGALKAVGTLALALYVLSGRGLDPAEQALAALVLTLTTGVFNLLDLRPGRSIKVMLVVVVALTLGSLDLLPLWTLGAFLGPALVLLPLDLREGGMLGDTGSSAIGATAGLWLVLTLPASGQAIALLLAGAITAYGELRSITALVERTPLLHRLDSLGRGG